MSKLEHSGVKGMKWGVLRNRNRPGGADGRPDASDVKYTKRGKLGKHMASLKREREWKKVLREVDTLSTKDINAVTKRIGLENSLKSLSKGPMARKKDKEDYLNRHKMDDQELARKIVRLQAKESLNKAIRSASKEQREFGIKVVQVASSMSVKYALNRGKLTPKDFINEAWNVSKQPKESYDKAKGDALDKVSNPIVKDILKDTLAKIEKKAYGDDKKK